MKWNHIQWKHRLVGVILFAAALILAVSFLVTYEIFIRKLEESSLYMTTQSFEQTARNIEGKLQNAEQEANSLLLLDSIADFWQERPATPEKQTADLRNALDEMSAAFVRDPDLFGLGIVSIEGRLLGTTRSNRTLHTALSPDSSTYEFLRGATTEYPYFHWYGGSALERRIPEGVPFSTMLQVPGMFEDGRDHSPVLLGVRSIVYGDERAPAYLVVTVRESAIRGCYSQVLYNQNTAMLVNRDGVVLSCTDPGLLGAELDCWDKLPADEVGSFGWQEEQVIHYPLPAYEWTLVNRIPMASYHAQANEIRLVITIVAVVTVLLMFSFFVLWTSKYAKPIDQLMGIMQTVASGDLSVPAFPASGIPELDQLGTQFCTTVRQLNEMIEKVKYMEEEKRKEELLALQYQINPHFLYNSLNSIRWLALLNGNEKVAESLAILARIIAPILRSPSFFWTVREEIGFVDSYVKMLTLRFGGAIDYQLECGEELFELSFPRFTLQPVIENCFTHGMIQGQGLRVRIRILRIDGLFQVAVSNTGSPIEPDVLRALNEALERNEPVAASGGSIGLANVNKRLHLLYGRNGCVRIESGETTVVRLTFGP